jgi:transglutaminase-like putative cysteine protease
MPRGLLGAALLFWGWQTGFLVVAAGMALALEARHLLRWRWDLARADFNRVSDLSAVLLVVIAVYQILGNESARAITGLFQWLPLTVFPLVFCQVFSAAGTVDASIFFWSLRRRADAEPSRQGTPVDLTYPYFALVVLASSAANVRSASFYVGLCVLAAWALWRLRSPRYATASWALALAAAVALGYAGHLGLAQLQRTLEQRASAWLLEYIRRDTDPYRNSTAIGQLGTVKLSDAIVVRVDAGEGRAPSLLRDAAYDVYSSPVWFATDAGFTAVRSEGDGASWTLAAPEAPSDAITISAYLRRGKGMLAIPAGTTRLDGLVVVDLSRNRLGAVKVEEGLGLVRYDARFGRAAAGDGAPTPADLAIPPREADVIARVMGDVTLAGRAPADRVNAIRGFFLGRFSYSRFLQGAPVGASPLEDFLLRTRAGHCEYFATATVLLLRAAGIPARYAVGYAVHEWSPLERRYVVRASDAHSWALAWIDGAWREIDTTPPEWRGDADSSLMRPFTDLWSWLSFGFSRWRWGERDDRLTSSIGWLLVPLLALLGWRLYRRRRVSATPAPTARAVTPGRGADSEFYLVERRLGALTFARAPGEPLTVWLARIDSAHVPGITVGPLSAVLALHYRYRFDPDGLPAAERQALAASAYGWLAEHEDPVR